jgi:hypothetical protein
MELKMKADQDSNTVPDDKYTPEKFPQPRTYPNGRNMETSFTEWTAHMMRQTKPTEEADFVWEPEKFPKPNTYPNGWDISGIYNDLDPRK